MMTDVLSSRRHGRHQDECVPVHPHRWPGQGALDNQARCVASCRWVRALHLLSRWPRLRAGRLRPDTCHPQPKQNDLVMRASRLGLC